MRRAVVALLSGGMDSTTLAYWLRSRVDELHLLSIDYGQRHKKEIFFAATTAMKLKATYEIIDLSGITRFLTGSALTSPEVQVPDGHYTADTMKITVVPNRNMIMLAIAAGYAVSRKLDALYLAIHAGDHAIYPDCRPEFYEALRQTIKLATEGFGEPDLAAPFVNKTKADIARIGAELYVPWEDTWSCYKGGEVHCGTCGTCVERREAFELAGVSDPTAYASKLEL